LNLKRCAATLEGWRQIYVLGDDTTIEQAVHAILDIILCNRWGVSEGVISEILGQYALRLCCLVHLSRANAQFLKLDITDAALMTTILELVRGR
jgi:hypothetical protein